jgi:hypothetical protein
MTRAQRDQVIAECAAKPGSAEDYPFGEAVAVFKVGARMFALAAQVRALLSSPDPKVRRLAARSACPCHGSFDLLAALKGDLRRLAATDPDAKVRQAARHVLSDAIEVNIADEAELSRERGRESRQQRRDRHRAIRIHAAIRRARRRASVRAR